MREAIKKLALQAQSCPRSFMSQSESSEDGLLITKFSDKGIKRIAEPRGSDLGAMPAREIPSDYINNLIDRSGLDPHLAVSADFRVDDNEPFAKAASSFIKDPPTNEAVSRLIPAARRSDRLRESSDRREEGTIHERALVPFRSAKHPARLREGPIDEQRDNNAGGGNLQRLGGPGKQVDHRSQAMSSPPLIQMSEPPIVEGELLVGDYPAAASLQNLSQQVQCTAPFWRHQPLPCPN